MIKIAIGSVYGGSGVSVVGKKGGKYQTKEAVHLISHLVRRLAAEHTTIEGAQLHDALKAPLRDNLKSLALRAASRRLLGETERSYLNDPFWKEVGRAWEDLLLPLASENPRSVSPNDCLEALSRPLFKHFQLDLTSVQTAHPHLWSKLEKDIQKTVAGPVDIPSAAKALDRWCLLLGQILASVYFRQQGGSKAFGELLADAKNAVSSKEQITHTQLASRIMPIIDSFLRNHFGGSLPAKEKEHLQSILLAPYIEKQLFSVNPVILQYYTPHDSLLGESELHLSNRIHILFTRTGPRVFASGTQVFFLKDGKPENRYKMTGSLWVDSPERHDTMSRSKPMTTTSGGFTNITKQTKCIVSPHPNPLPKERELGFPPQQATAESSS